MLHPYIIEFINNCLLKELESFSSTALSSNEHINITVNPLPKRDGKGKEFHIVTVTLNGTSSDATFNRVYWINTKNIELDDTVTAEEKNKAVVLFLFTKLQAYLKLNSTTPAILCRIKDGKVCRIREHVLKSSQACFTYATLYKILKGDELSPTDRQHCDNVITTYNKTQLTKETSPTVHAADAPITNVGGNEEPSDAYPTLGWPPALVYAGGASTSGYSLLSGLGGGWFPPLGTPVAAAAVGYPTFSGWFPSNGYPTFGGWFPSNGYPTPGWVSSAGFSFGGLGATTTLGDPAMGWPSGAGAGWFPAPGVADEATTGRHPTPPDEAAISAGFTADRTAAKTDRDPSSAIDIQDLLAFPHTGSHQYAFFPSAPKTTNKRSRPKEEPIAPPKIATV